MTIKVSPKFEQYLLQTAGPFHSDPKGLNSFSELLTFTDEYGPNGDMPVYRLTPAELAASPFNTAEAAMAFQVWHDRRHVRYNQHFDLSGEQFLAMQHVDELWRAGQNPTDVFIVYALIYGRNAYYYNNGHRAIAATAINQFVEDALEGGVEYAARDRRRDALEELEAAFDQGLIKGFF